MNGWEQIIIQFGGFGLLGFFFYLLMRWVMKGADDINKERTAEIRAFSKATADFTKTAADFATVMGNEQEHLTRAVEQLTRMVERLCEK